MCMHAFMPSHAHSWFCMACLYSCICYFANSFFHELFVTPSRFHASRQAVIPSVVHYSTHTPIHAFGDSSMHYSIHCLSFANSFHPLRLQAYCPTRLPYNIRHFSVRAGGVANRFQMCLWPPLHFPDWNETLACAG